MSQGGVCGKRSRLPVENNSGEDREAPSPKHQREERSQPAHQASCTSETVFRSGGRRDPTEDVRSLDEPVTGNPALQDTFTRGLLLAAGTQHETGASPAGTAEAATAQAAPRQRRGGTVHQRLRGRSWTVRSKHQGEKTRGDSGQARGKKCAVKYSINSWEGRKRRKRGKERWVRQAENVY